MSQFEQVREFHKAFGVADPDKPTLLENKEQRLRISLIREELEEYIEAVTNDDLVEAADALCDLAYVVFGAAACHGFTRFDEMFDEVQRSNMSKLGLDGKPIIREDGKIMKGPGFFKPNLVQFM